MGCRKRQCLFSEPELSTLNTTDEQTDEAVPEAQNRLHVRRRAVGVPDRRRPALLARSLDVRHQRAQQAREPLSHHRVVTAQRGVEKQLEELRHASRAFWLAKGPLEQVERRVKRLAHGKTLREHMAGVAHARGTRALLGQVPLAKMWQEAKPPTLAGAPRRAQGWLDSMSASAAHAVVLVPGIVGQVSRRVMRKSTGRERRARPHNSTRSCRSSELVLVAVLSSPVSSPVVKPASRRAALMAAAPPPRPRPCGPAGSCTSTASMPAGTSPRARS